MLPDLGGHAALTDKLGAALVDSPPLDASKGGYIAEGYDAALDALRNVGSDGRRAIAALEARYREATGVAALKIRHNAVLGYHIEVAARHADRLMARRQRLHPSPDAWPAWCASIRPTSTPRRAAWSRPAPTRSPPRPPMSRN